MLNESVFDRRGDLDVLEWLTYAKHYAKNGDDVMAFQAYYMAHLLGYERIATNADLPFNTHEK